MPPYLRLGGAAPQARLAEAGGNRTPSTPVDGVDGEDGVAESTTCDGQSVDGVDQADPEAAQKGHSPPPEKGES